MKNLTLTHNYVRIISLMLWLVLIKTSILAQEYNVCLSSLGGIATAISEGTYGSDTRYANYSIDGDKNTTWSSEGSMPAWLKVKFDKIYSIDKVGIWWGSHKHIFSVELSVDGSKWTKVISSRSSNNSEGSETVHEVLSITEIEARFIKINIESTSAPSSHIFQASVSELEAYTSSVEEILWQDDFSAVSDWTTKIYKGNGSFTNETFDGHNVGTFYMEGSPGVVFTYKELVKTIPAGSKLKAKWFYETSGACGNSENSGGGSIWFMGKISDAEEPTENDKILSLFDPRVCPMRQWNEEEFEITQEIPAGKYIAIGGAVWPSYVINHWDYIQITSDEEASEMLKVLKPNGGENWRIGSTQYITWTSNNISNVKIEYSTNNGVSWNTIISNTPAAANSFEWEIKSDISDNCLIKISDANNSAVSDVSDSVFSTYEGNIDLLNPIPNQTLVLSEPYLEYDLSSVFAGNLGAPTYQAISSNQLVVSASIEGAILKLTPISVGESEITIRIIDITGEQCTQSFKVSVITKNISIISPNGGENWQIGLTQNITWTSSNVSNVKLEYITNYGYSGWSTITSSTPSNGSYTWEIPNQPSTSCKIRITDVEGTTSDESDSFFKITGAPSITVTSPNGGEIMRIGSEHYITWTSSNVKNVKIDYSFYDGSWSNIVNSTRSDGSYKWTIPNGSSSTYLIRISDIDSDEYDESDNFFSTFQYDSRINITKTITAQPFSSTNYKLVSLPGITDILIGDVFSGKHGSDWNAYWDNGYNGSGKQAYQVEYNGTSDFRFQPGRSFWVLCSNHVAISQTVDAVEVDQNTIYAIPLHAGWNLIANPFNKLVSWGSVKNVNYGITQSLWKFNGSTFTEAATMEVYEGYYFNNTTGLTSLKIPYVIASGTLQKKQDTDAKINLELINNMKSVSEVGIVYDAGSSNSNDIYDIYSPGNSFTRFDINMICTGVEGRNKYLKVDSRPDIEEGHEYVIEIFSEDFEELELLFDIPDKYSQYAFYIFDEEFGDFNLIKDSNRYSLGRIKGCKYFKLLIGTENYIDEKKESLIPTEFSLFQNYPNPFNPETKIRFALPEQSVISLNIYNTLGELVTILIDNEIHSGGYHEVQFKADNLPSGIYIYQLQSMNSFVAKKMIYLK